MPNQIYKRFKIVLLGDSSVGKTCLILRYVSKTFKNYLSNTIGCSFFSKIEKINDIDYALDIWDTAGQERFRSLLSLYYRNTQIVFICIDISENVDISIKNIKYWIDELNTYIDNNRIIILVGTKSDLVSNDIIDSFIKKIKNIFDLDLLITSSKTGLNIEHLFRTSILKANEKYTKINQFEIEDIESSSLSNLSKWCSIL